MKESIREEQMEAAVHMLLKDDRKYREQLVGDLTKEEYERFLEECPEFLEDE